VLHGVSLLLLRLIILACDEEARLNLVQNFSNFSQRSYRLGAPCNVKVSLPPCLIKHVDMNMYGKWKNSSTYSWFWHWVDLSVYLHNPIDVPSGERCRSTVN
jgi:hypothetical protein